MNQSATSKKPFLTTWLLSLFFGVLGIDRFYLGKIGTGILKFITLGGLGVWILIDLYLILKGTQTDKSKYKLEGYKQHRVKARIITGILLAFLILVTLLDAAFLPSLWLLLLNDFRESPWVAVSSLATVGLLYFVLVEFRKSASQKRRILSLENRPYIYLGLEMKDNGAIYLTLANIGKLPAYDINISAKDLSSPKWTTDKKINKIQELSWFTKPITHIAPGQSFRTLYAHFPDLPRGLGVGETDLKGSKVTISYNDPNGEPLTTPSYDLDPDILYPSILDYRGNPLNNINDSLSTINDSLSTINENADTLALSQKLTQESIPKTTKKKFWFANSVPISIKNSSS